MTTANRAAGALLGLAVGDALGTTLEFCAPGTFRPITDIVGGGPFALAPGEWTDDTSMALCLADSITACGGMDATDQMRRYLRWYREGYLSSTGRCFDIGRTTRESLERFERTGDPIAGPTSIATAGNGSIMRLAPVAIWSASRDVDGVALCAESSRTTHGALVAVDACRLLGALIIGALRGATKADILASHYAPDPGYWRVHPLCPEIDAISLGSYQRKSPSEIRGRGYATESLEAALWAFNGAGDFREGCLAAANLGDDADSTAAVFGQIAGAYYGLGGIPVDWVYRTHMHTTIVEMAGGLLPR